MKKFVLSAALLFSALAGNAEGISSPSGMVKLDFELTKDCLLYTSPSPRD